MDGRLIIYSPDGNVIAQIEKWEFHDTYMGEQYVSFNINSEKPISWSLGCYCIYRGVKFTINYIPSVTQKARKFETGEAFVYDNVKFESPREELTRIIMLDITATTGDYIAALGTNFTGSAQFELFCGKTSVAGTTYTPVCALAAKIQANLDRVFKGENAWRVIVDLENTDTLDKMLTFDNTTLQAALEMLYNEFKISYSIVGRTISIGSSLKYLTANEDGAFFHYGYGKGTPSVSESGIVKDSGTALYEIKRSSDSSQKIVTRLRALGSQKNLPYRYYNKKYLNEQGEHISQSMHPTALQLPATFLPLGTPEDAPGSETKWGKNKTHSELYANVLGDTNDSYIDKNDDAEHTEEGIREECARWDGSNADLEEIYPTIKDMTYGHLRAALTPDINGITPTGESDMSAYKNYANTERVDEILSFDELTNYGDGLLAENKIDTQGRETLTLTENMQKFAIIGNKDWNVIKGNITIPVKWLFTIDDVAAGRWMLSPEEQHVFFGASLSLGQHNGGEVKGQMVIKYRLHVVTANNNVSILKGKNGNTIDFYESDEITLTNYKTYTELEIEALPDSKRQDLAKVSSILMEKRGSVKIGVSVVLLSNKRNGVDTNIANDECNDTTVAWRVGLSDSQRKDPDISKLTSFMWYRENTSSTYMNTNFTLYIKDFGVQEMVSCFNTSEDAVIAMTSGYCVGREFKIVSDVPQKVVVNGKTCWKVECSRAQDSALQTYYPSEVDYITTEDTFVLLNVSMPDSYIQVAEMRLLEAATRYLADNCNTKYTYQPSIDDIYLVRDFDLHGEKSVYWNLYAGYKFPFFGIPDNANQDPTDVIVELTIKSLTIKEGDGITPKVELTLNDKVEQSTIQKLTTAVDRLYNGSAITSGGGLDLASIRNYIANYGREMFVSKTSDDTVHGNIKFDKSISSTDFSSGEFGKGWGASNRIDGSYVESDYLTIRKSAYFRMLTISEVKHVGGELILSAASCQLSRVEEFADFYRCYFDASANGVIKYNEWIVGDQARCQVWDGTSAIKYYWRLVVGTGTEDNEHYIDLSKEIADGTSAPEANDNVVLLGCRNMAAENDYRRSAQVYSTVEQNAPSRKFYTGIKSFVLPYPFETMEMDAEGAHWNIGGNIGNYINYQNGSLTMNVDNMVIGSTDVEAAISDKFDTYIDDQNDAPLDGQGQVVERIVYNEPAYPWFPSQEWTLEERYERLGDFYLTKDGFSYKFTLVDDEYYWILTADQYLINAMNEANHSTAVLTNMANDNIITVQEKTAINSIWTGIAAEYENIVSKASLYPDNEGVTSALASYEYSYNALRGVMSTILEDEADFDSPLVDKDGNQRTFTFYVGLHPYGVTYSLAWDNYYRRKALLEYAISNATLEKIDEVAISGGYDENVTRELQALRNMYTGLSGAWYGFTSTGFYQYVQQLRPDTTFAGALLTTANFTTLSNTITLPNGETLEAMMGTYVAKDGKNYITGAKIKADQIDLQGKTMSFTGNQITINTDNFKLKENGDVEMRGTVVAENKQKMHKTVIDPDTANITLYGPSVTDQDGNPMPSATYTEHASLSYNYNEDGAAIASLFLHGFSNDVRIDDGEMLLGGYDSSHTSLSASHISGAYGFTSVQMSEAGIDLDGANSKLHFGYDNDGNNNSYIDIGSVKVLRDGIKIGGSRNYLLITSSGITIYADDKPYKEATFDYV